MTGLERTTCDLLECCFESWVLFKKNNLAETFVPNFSFLSSPGGNVEWKFSILRQCDGEKHFPSRSALSCVAAEKGTCC